MTYRLEVESVIKDETGTNIIISASSYENDAMVRFLVPLEQQDLFFIGKLLSIEVAEIVEEVALPGMPGPVATEGNA